MDFFANNLEFGGSICERVPKVVYGHYCSELLERFKFMGTIGASVAG